MIDVTASNLRTGDPMLAVTLLVESPALPKPQVVITDDYGKATIPALPDGDYNVTAYYDDITLVRRGIRVDHATGAHLELALDEDSRKSFRIHL